jgi:hypothetical protein
MTQRNANHDRAMAAQAATAVGLLRAALKRALSRGVCPECGGRLHREGAALVCRTPECEGVGRVVFALDCHRAEVRARS